MLNTTEKPAEHHDPSEAGRRGEGAAVGFAGLRISELLQPALAASALLAR